MTEFKDLWRLSSVSARAENSPRREDWGLHPPSAVCMTAVQTRAGVPPDSGQALVPRASEWGGDLPTSLPHSARKLNPGLPAARNTFQNCCEDCLHIKFSDHTRHIVGA